MLEGSGRKYNLVETMVFCARHRSERLKGRRNGGREFRSIYRYSGQR